MKRYNTLKIEEREDGISIITFNRPERLNAMNFELIEDMFDYLNQIQNSYEIRVIILTGEGRAFSSGTDLKDSQVILKKKIPEEFKKFKYLLTNDKVKRLIIIQRLLGQVMMLLRKIPQPVIAAVRGPAYGGGLAFALGADIRIAGESAEFCNQFINIGVSGSDCGSSYWLPRLIGFSRAAEFMYTGRVINAKEADQIGLVSKVVADDRILNEALNVAKQLLTKSPMGIRFTKDALNMNIDAPSLEAAIELENRNQVICFNTSDAVEGILSMLEKREPKYDKW
jgi:enoyl-CoA hydratase